MLITDDVLYAGVNDHQIDLFEGQYPVPRGMAYNSYVIMDEKIAVMDSVGQPFGDIWLANLRQALHGRKPDYLVVHHMEPDHSANIGVFLRAYPEAAVVASAKAFAMMEHFFGADFAARRIVIGEGSALPLGRHTLTFYAAPMVHWPEVMVSYDDKDRILFSADAFGKFGALDADEEWACEARRYYVGIVGKYGAAVQALLKKVSGLDIAVICPLHGPALTGNLKDAISLYDIWSSYRAESEGVAIAYASFYGHTKAAALLLAQKLKAKGIAVAVHDLTRCDLSEAVEDAFRCSKLVLAAATYNGGVFPVMKAFIDHLTERNYQQRTVALMENGSWAPAAARAMTRMLEGCKGITFAANTVCILSALHESSRAQIDALAEELAGESNPPSVS